jgi:hypothetical protein
VPSQTDIPAQEKLQLLINKRYQHPVLDGTGIKELAERNFIAGRQAVFEAFADLAGLKDISAIRSMERPRTDVGKATRRR